MLITKIGYAHVQNMSNCQDAGVETEYGDDKFKLFCLADGCSEGKHSEVGAKLFCKLFPKYKNIDTAFRSIRQLFYDMSYTDPQEYVQTIIDYMMFTIMTVCESAESYQVVVAGDGYIITQTHEDKLNFIPVDQGMYAAYYGYNYLRGFVDLKQYNTGVELYSTTFNKQDVKAVGIASDGLRYILGSDFQEEFERLLIARKEFAIRRLINKHHSVVKDDITIII